MQQKMWKEIGILCGKLVLLLLPFFVLLPLYCRFFPFYYLDEEYAMYRQQNDFVTGMTNGKESNEVENPQIIVIGDSRAKAAFDPALLSTKNSVYNLALGGTTPIEGYYSLEKYLTCHEKPQTVVLSYAPMHLMDVDTLWTRCIYFHTFDASSFRDLTMHAQDFSKTEKILIDHYAFEYLMYQCYMPNKYATALKKSAFVLRHKTTTKKYTAMEEFKGHTFYGTADYSDGIDGEAKVEDFVESDIIAWYLQRTIDLCHDNGIKVIVEQAPVNETSYRIITPDFKEHFRSYMNQLAAKNPQDAIYTDFYRYPNESFGDADHLNAKGVQQFCEQMKEKYGF